MRYQNVVVLVVALAFAAIGPRVTMPHDRDSGQPFAYEPPDGFVPSPDDIGPGDQAWSDPTSAATKLFVPKVSVHETTQIGTVEPDDLAKLAAQMPEVNSSVSWAERRHETRVRTDGAHVGLLEGDATRVRTLFNGLPPIETKFRMMQLVFPEDKGTAIVTAMYATEDAPKWEPTFEATIARAHGVALRVPAPPPWAYAGWAAAGAVLGFLATSIAATRSRAKAASS